MHISLILCEKMSSCRKGVLEIVTIGRRPWISFGEEIFDFKSEPKCI